MNKRSSCLLKMRAFYKKQIDLEKNPMKFSDDEAVNIMLEYKEVKSHCEDCRLDKGIDGLIPELKKSLDKYKEHILGGEYHLKKFEEKLEKADSISEKMECISAIQKIKKINGESMIKKRRIETFFDKLEQIK